MSETSHCSQGRPSAGTARRQRTATRHQSARRSAGAWCRPASRREEHHTCHVKCDAPHTMRKARRVANGMLLLVVGLIMGMRLWRVADHGWRNQTPVWLGCRCRRLTTKPGSAWWLKFPCMEEQYRSQSQVWTTGLLSGVPAFFLSRVFTSKDCVQGWSSGGSYLDSCLRCARASGVDWSRAREVRAAVGVDQRHSGPDQLRGNARAAPRDLLSGR
eukprot:COSAG06_NODE_1243_length_10120_cov_29.242092_9_plen_216_part_00